MKILHLEDNPSDAELVRALLHHEWPDCEITHAADKSSYLNTVQRGGFDLVLSDFSLIDFNGIEALHVAQKTLPGVPFIFLSGNIGEDRAIEAVREGADDYVLKDRMKRLVTAIQRAMRESYESKRLRAAEEDRERLAGIIENTLDFVGMVAVDGKILYLNRAARRLLGVTESALPPMFDLRDVQPPEIAEYQLSTNFPEAIRRGAWAGETVLRTRDGEMVPVSQVILAHHAADGHVDHLSTVMRDLTAQKKSESLIAGQKQVLEMIAGGEPIKATLTALLRLIETQDHTMLCSVLLLSEDGQHLRHGAAPRLPAAYMQAIDGVAIGPNVGSCGTAAHLRASVFVSDIATDPLWENYRDLALGHGLRSCWATPIFDGGHRPIATFAVYGRQAGQPTPAQLQLMDSATHIAAICLNRDQNEQRLRDQADLLNKARDAIVLFDLNDQVTFWNNGAERIFGWTSAEAIGRADLFGRQIFTGVPRALQAIERDGEWHGEIPGRDKANRDLILECRITQIRDQMGQPQGRLVIATDITAKKRIEEQFLRAQRLESIGMLAAGIAHDLNNVLAPILLAAPMLREHVGQQEDLPIIEALEKSAERGANLVRQILSFAHGADGEHRLIQPKHILRDLAGFIEQTFPKTIQLIEHIPGDLWPINANATQIHQVLLNLCVNARDAMPEGGVLSLRAENCVLDEGAAGAIEGGRAGAFLVLHVEDTGTGMPPDVLARIWEPFYTTKGVGKGTGLGLSTVRGIVENHSGFITVRSEIGCGTTFRVYLQAAEITDERTASSTGEGLPPRGEGELVLVVDDESNVRDMTAAILARHGYRVLTAPDGAEAVALFAPRSTEIQLVVSDLGMPNLDGATLANVIRRIKPDMKVLITSGLNSGSKGSHPPQTLSYAFLLKPFKPEALLTMVARLLHPTAEKPVEPV